MTLIVVKDKLREKLMVLQILVLLICIYLLGITLNFEWKSIFKTKDKECPEKLISFLIGGYQQAQTGHIPAYKFYSSLVGELITYRNRFGCEIRSSLIEIRKSLSADIKESQKIKDSFLGGVFQYIFLVIFLWVFLYFARESVQLAIPALNLVLLCSWQFLGGVTYLICFKALKASTFRNFDLYLRALYKFKIMLKVSRPLNEIIKSIELDRLPESSSVRHLKRRVEFLCHEIKHRGRVEGIEVELTLTETWDFYEIQLTKFNKYLGIIKMALIFIFVLPSFFFITTLILGSMGI
jgi:hypothetical protein